MRASVWVESWELECCTSDAVVGLTWSCTPELTDPLPWWASYPSQPLPGPVRTFGVTYLDLRPVELASRRGRYGLAATAGGHVAVVGLADPSPRQVTGRLVHQGHGALDDELGSSWSLRGRVVRVFGVTLIRERRHGMAVPVGQEPPVPLAVTGTNVPGRKHRTYGRAHDEFVVVLDL